DRRTLAWFPVVGALIGTVLGGVWWGAERLWPVPVAAALVVAADLALTGMLHFDGLMDSADGLLPHLTRDRRLDVMPQPDVGALAVALLARRRIGGFTGDVLGAAGVIGETVALVIAAAKW